MLSHHWIFAALLSLGVCTPALAETGTFDLSLAGIRIGTLTYAGKEANGQYAAKGVVRASPLARAVMDVEIDTESKGRVNGNTYRPTYFEATEVKNGETLTLVARYSGGVPKVERIPAKKKRNKHAAPASEQKGTLDSLTTAYAMLRDRPKNLACKLDIDLFDGERRSGIRFAKAEPRRGDGITCHGEYRRLQGFKPEEMAEKSVWPFTVIYEPAGDVMRVSEVVVPTTFGNVRMVRR